MDAARTQGQRGLTFGRQGSGKTSLLRSCLARRSGRVFVLDPYKEYIDLAVQVSSLADAAAYMRRAPNWKLAYHNRHLNDDFEPICRGLMAVGGDCLFHIVEAERVWQTKKTPPALLENIKARRAHAAP